MNIKLIQPGEKIPLAAVYGHVGVGHVHSHSSYVQDDSAGFAVVASLLKRALDADTRIERVESDLTAGIVKVYTVDGGVGMSFARRGITPQEARILSQAAGMEGICTQNVAVSLFGRMYGQGAAETPVAFQGALALAVMDTFVKKGASLVLATADGVYEDLIDRMAAAAVEIDGIPVALMLVINGSQGGVGPAEDNEGNTALGEKGGLVDRMFMREAPSIIVESKAFVPAWSKDVKGSTYLVRAEKGIDGADTAAALIAAAAESKLPCRFLDNAMPQSQNQMRELTESLGKRIAALGTALQGAETAEEKVKLAAELTKLASEDLGGVTFMSEQVHHTARGAGIVPGKAAVLSMVVDEEYIHHWKIPRLEERDVEGYCDIVTAAVKILAKGYSGGLK